jgi:tRNA A-37 threonylcarbamoyl transferase component Bud32
MHLAKTPDGAVWASGLGVTRVVFAGPRARVVEEPLAGRHWEGLDIETNPSSGDLWACYEGGLAKRDLAGWLNVTEKDGLLQNICRSIAVSPMGDVWYAYNTIPAFTRIRMMPGVRSQVQHFRSGDDIGNASTFFLDFDQRGRLWRGSVDGVYVAREPAAQEGRWLHLNEVDGLPGDRAGDQSFYADPDGSIWAGLDTSLMHFRLPADLLETKPATVFLSALSWDGRTPRMAEAIEAIPNGAKVTAHIGSLQFDRRNALRVRYRMKPEQDAWTESRNLDVALGEVVWGRHTLEIQGRLGSVGAWSSTTYFPLSVLRPAWLSPPVLIGSPVATLLGFFGFRRWQKKRKRRESKAFPDLTALRMAALVPEAVELAGTTFDERFTVQRLIARGGFATVFEGFDQRLNKRCAIKVFHREVADQGLARRFQHEIEALETIAHPNVVRLCGHGTTPTGVPYLVMEFVEGSTLRDALGAVGFPPHHVASLLRQAGNALGAIHAHGIYHRDLKPENLMIRSVSQPGEDLVLIDFSIAIVQSPDESLHGISRAAGTFEYMAPEQAVGFVDAASDIYSLAKVTLEMLTGKRLSQLLPNASRDLPQRVRELLTGMPFALSPASRELLSSALEFDPDKRPSSAVQFASQIAADLESSRTNPTDGL